jgi:hypothetical protein
MRRRMVGGSGCLWGRRMQVRYINAVLWQPGAAHGNSLLTIPVAHGERTCWDGARMPNAPRYVAHVFARPRTGNAAYSGSRLAAR